MCFFLPKRFANIFFRCDVSGDGEMDLDELATFLKASVRDI
jgi:Ca2+-binding EF-hand superfamily protein